MSRILTDPKIFIRRWVALIQDFFIAIFQRLQCTQNARVLIVDVKAAVDRSIEPRENRQP